jgi:hypothetical protein
MYYLDLKFLLTHFVHRPDPGETRPVARHRAILERHIGGNVGRPYLPNTRLQHDFRKMASIN